MGPSASLSLVAMFHLVRSKDLYEMETEYSKNMPPGKDVDVSLSLHINRISGVDESKEEIALDVFLHVYWEDPRIRILDNTSQVELTWDKDPRFWIPDLYIRQLREMKVLTLFQDIASIRLYNNSTLRISIGATIIIKCDMDFVLYPLDVQTCAVDFGSYKYTMMDMKFRWREDPLSFPSDFGDGFRLPRYVVSFVTDNRSNVIYYGDGNHSTARLVITLSRELRSHLLESYLPSTLFVIMSWGSFVVMPEVVPGRMVLLVTTLLSLVTMFDTIRRQKLSARRRRQRANCDSSCSPNTSYCTAGRRGAPWTRCRWPCSHCASWCSPSFTGYRTSASPDGNRCRPTSEEPRRHVVNTRAMYTITDVNNVVRSYGRTSRRRRNCNKMYYEHYPASVSVGIRWRFIGEPCFPFAVPGQN
ncbi:glycine receptor subunit alpha-4-like isoform X3 [Sipha flava]|uniref:Glycine receptor subunit alpha-4-like isoform X3 n=1 Tax=Sipha flava TaxID=143950 RepID=A0A8B8FLD3_9HEMI|nr:glycine receptor subunit alpha-4-like isoform X3 [Sipha flava]